MTSFMLREDFFLLLPWKTFSCYYVHTTAETVLVSNSAQKVASQWLLYKKPATNYMASGIRDLVILL